MEDLTHLLRAVRAGNQTALRNVFSITYDELCRLARRHLRKNSTDSMLDMKSLVHECYLRIARTERLPVQDRAHFFRYAARVMQCICIDCAREATAQRRSIGQSFPITSLDIPDHEAVSTDESVLLDTALQQLACKEARLAVIIAMKYFFGFTDAEIAGKLGVAERTIRRDWQRARLLLAATSNSRHAQPAKSFAAKHKVPAQRRARQVPRAGVSSLWSPAVLRSLCAAEPEYRASNEADTYR